MEEYNDLLKKDLSINNKSVFVEKKLHSNEIVNTDSSNFKQDFFNNNNKKIIKESDSEPEILENTEKEITPEDNLRELNLLLQQDYGTASTYFKAMRSAVRELSAYTFNEEKNKDEYNRLILEAFVRSKSYLKVHGCKLIYDKASTREKRAMDILKALDKITKKNNAEEYNRADIELGQIDKEILDPTKELSRLARVQMNIGRINFVAKKSSFDSEKRSKLPWYKLLGNKIYGGVAAILGSTIGGVAALISMITSPVKKISNREEPVTKYFWDNKQELQESDSDNYKQELQESDSGNQDEINPLIIQNDNAVEVMKKTNRIPAVWEVEIPENAEKPATVSLDIMQAVEGKETGFDVYRHELGHTFMTVKYSRKDPISGKKKRYMTQFGFYPKGGQGMVTSAGQVQHGIFVPGQINNDYGHKLHTGVSFAVDNIQVNKLFDYTSKYEKDGYNFVKRNCTTFVRDAAKHIGLEPDQYFKQRYYKNNGTGWAFAAASLGTLYIRRKSKVNILNLRDRDDYSIQKLGRKMTTEEDVINLNATDYNMEVYGYSPSHAGETMRASENYRLHSNDFDFDDQKESHELSEYMALVSTACENLPREVKAYMKEQGVSADEQLERFENYIDILRQNLSQHAFNLELGGFLENGSLDILKAADISHAKEMIFNAVADIDARIEEINSIFAETFLHDSGLNLVFSRMVAALEKYKGAYFEIFNNINNARSYHMNIIRQYSSDDVSEDDDAFQSKAVLLHGEVKVFLEKYNISFKTNPAEYMAYKKMFGSVERGLQGFALYNRFAGNVEIGKKGKAESDDEQMKAEFSNLSEEEKNLFREFGKKKNAVNDLIEYEKTFINNKEYSQSDLELIFGEMSLHEYNNDINVMNSDLLTVSPMQTYAGIVYGNIFKGTKAEIKKNVNDKYLPILNDFISKYKNQNGTDAENLNEELHNALKNVQRELAAGIEKNLMKKMNESDVFKKICYIFIDRMEKEALEMYPEDGTNMEIAEMRKHFTDFNYVFRLHETFIHSFLKPLLEDVLSSLAEEYNSLLINEMGKEMASDIDIADEISLEESTALLNMFSFSDRGKTAKELHENNKGNFFEMLHKMIQAS